MGSNPIGRTFLVFLPQGHRPRCPLANEPTCASNGEGRGRWWTSRREVVCWCSETGKFFADRDIFTNRRSKSTLLVSPIVIDGILDRSKSPRVASPPPRKSVSAGSRVPAGQIRAARGHDPRASRRPARPRWPAAASSTARRAWAPSTSSPTCPRRSRRPPCRPPRASRSCRTRWPSRRHSCSRKDPVFPSRVVCLVSH